MGHWKYLVTALCALMGVQAYAQGTAVYIANSGAHEIFQCTVGSDGGFANCSATTSGIGNNPTGLATFNNNGAHYLYVSNQSSNSVSKCTINADGSLSSCA